MIHFAFCKGNSSIKCHNVSCIVCVFFVLCGSVMCVEARRARSHTHQFNGKRNICDNMVAVEMRAFPDAKINTLISWYGQSRSSGIARNVTWLAVC